MRTGIVSNSILCLPLLYHLGKEDITVFSGEQAVNCNGTVASFCAGAGISCTSRPDDRSNGHETGNGQSLYDWVDAQQPDIIFIIGHNRIIHANRFGKVMPELYNVHFGHLPEYRGPNPVFWQLKNGAPGLAITIHRISERLDAGAVAWKKEFPNEPFFSYGYVHQLMSHFLVEGVHSLLQLKKKGQPIPVTQQDDRNAAYFGRPGQQDVCICWNTMRAAAICDLVKACNPWNNGAITTYNGFEVRISDAECVSLTTGSNGNNTYPAGTILDTSNPFLVSCINNEAIRIHTLVVNGILMPARFAANYGFTRGQSFKKS
jgi:methionyl-tRNA formyltransferase